MIRTAAVLGPAIGALALAAAALGIGGASAQPASTRVIDRTMLCEAANHGLVHIVDAEAASAIGSTEASVGLITELRAWRLALLSDSELMLSPACRLASARVPLTSKGLRGGIASPFGDTFACVTPRVVLVRVRAVFTNPVMLRFSSNRPYGPPLLFAGGNLKEGSLAVRTRKGKHLVYGAVSGGKARLLTRTRDCIPK